MVHNSKDGVHMAVAKSQDLGEWVGIELEGKNKNLALGNHEGQPDSLA